jgi:hypothetical protein
MASNVVGLVRESGEISLMSVIGEVLELTEMDVPSAPSLQVIAAPPVWPAGAITPLPVVPVLSPMNSRLSSVEVPARHCQWFPEV